MVGEKVGVGGGDDEEAMVSEDCFQEGAGFMASIRSTLNIMGGRVLVLLLALGHGHHRSRVTGYSATLITFTNRNRYIISR